MFVIEVISNISNNSIFEPINKYVIINAIKETSAALLLADN